MTAKKPVMFMNLNNAFRFRRGWKLEADLNVMTKGDMMQFAFLRNTYALNLTVQKCCLMHSTLTFPLRGTSAV